MGSSLRTATDDDVDFVEPVCDFVGYWHFRGFWARFKNDLMVLDSFATNVGKGRLSQLKAA